MLKQQAHRVTLGHIWKIENCIRVGGRAAKGDRL